MEEYVFRYPRINNIGEQFVHHQFKIFSKRFVSGDPLYIVTMTTRLVGSCRYLFAKYDGRFSVE